MSPHPFFRTAIARRLAPLLLGAVALAASLPALAIKPFTADYQANYMGLQAQGRMTLAEVGGGRWKYTLDVHNALATLSQSTTFDAKGGQWRPLSGSDKSMLLVKHVDKTADYDWSKGQARWSGDVKPERSGPVTLHPGDLDAMLINLAIVRDVAAGKPLDYRMVDDGRTKQMSYQVAGTETITIAGKPQQATKVMRSDGDKQTLLWIVEGMPVPARILQRKDGKDEMDLQLTALR